MNGFEKLCEELEKNPRAKEDMGYVKLYLVNKIHDNKDEFLKLKAECKSSDFMPYASYMLSMGVLLFTTTSALLDYINSISQITYNINWISKVAAKATSQIDYIDMFISFAVFLGGLGTLFYVFKKVQKYHYVFKWEKYIAVYLDDIEKNWDNYF